MWDAVGPLDRNTFLTDQIIIIIFRVLNKWRVVSSKAVSGVFLVIHSSRTKNTPETALYCLKFFPKCDIIHIHNYYNYLTLFSLYFFGPCLHP